MEKQIITILSLKDNISKPLMKISKSINKVTIQMKKSQKEIETWKNNSIKAMNSVIKKTSKAKGFGALVVDVEFKGLEKLDGADAEIKSILSGAKSSESIEAYGLTSIKVMQDISNILLVTQILIVKSVNELGNSLDSVAQIAKSVCVSLSEVAGAIGCLAKKGESTSKSMTGLKGIMSKVGKSAKQASGIIKKLKIGDIVKKLEPADITNKDLTVGDIAGKLSKNVEVIEKWKNKISLLDKVLKLKILTLIRIVLVIGAVIAIGYLLYKNWDKIKAKACELGKALKGFSGKYLAKPINIFKNLGKIIWDIVLDIIDSFKPVGLTLKTIFDQIVGIIKGLIKKVVSVIKKIVSVIKGVWDFLAPILLQIVTFIASVFIAGLILYFMKMVNIVKAVVTTIAGVLNGLLTILSGIIDFVVGIFTGDWEKAWEGLTTIFSGFIEILKSLWQGVIDLFAVPVDAVINLLDAIFGEKVDSIKKIWEKLKEVLKNPIKAVVEFFKGNSTGPAYAKGTSYSSAGYARIHEEGGEIRKLSSGEMIIPADKSDRLLKNKSIGQDVKVEVKILGNVIGNRQFINEVGNEVYRKVSLAYQNV